jgi:hypothetical protein
MIQLGKTGPVTSEDFRLVLSDLQKTAFSKGTREVLERFGSTPMTARVEEVSERPEALGTGAELAESLFNAAASAKIKVSTIAMFLDQKWRRRLFEQIDELHSLEDWEIGALPLEQQSFAAFLKAMFILKPPVKPGLGLSVTGQLVAAWTVGKDQLTLRFIDRSRVRVTYNRGLGDEKESGIFETPLEKLTALVAAIDGHYWLQQA